MNDEGKQVQWGNDVWRVDTAVGYRFTNYLQGKVQYSFKHDDAKIQTGEQLIAAQLTKPDIKSDAAAPAKPPVATPPAAKPPV